MFDTMFESERALIGKIIGKIADNWRLNVDCTLQRDYSLGEKGFVLKITASEIDLGGEGIMGLDWFHEQFLKELSELFETRYKELDARPLSTTRSFMPGTLFENLMQLRQKSFGQKRIMDGGLRQGEVIETPMYISFLILSEPM